MKLFLGVDGGQSGTTALVGDENGRIVGVGRAGPANLAGEADALGKFAGALRDAVRAAAGEAPFEAMFEAACLGFSGGAEDKDALARQIVKAKHYSITDDACIALAGATGGGCGIVTIAGTGSVAFGKNAEGRTARAGGWGYAFGDEGGAFGIVRDALRAALRFEEGWGPPTALRAALVEHGEARDANDLLHRFYTGAFRRARIAALATLVDEVARSGDAAAREMLNGAAQSLATLASAVRGQLFVAGEAVTISYAGGVFQSAMVLERFRMLVELDEGNRVAAPKFGPAAGALLEAYRIAGMRRALDGPADTLRL